MHSNTAETGQVENATKIGVSVEKSSDLIDRRFSVAPMMDWTDRHCRYFLRGFSPTVLLYTEMVTAEALLRGNAQRLLRYHRDEHPLALQLGGSDPARLAAAARLGAEAGYDEINLNCGCPSDRVHAGAFGACLMRSPQRVADCVAAMRAAVGVPVTVKMRIGVVEGTGAAARERAQQFDAHDEAALHDFISAIAAAGCDIIIVHARKAVLGGLSPAENREVPPLRHDVVRAIKQQFPALQVILNGGLRDAAESRAALEWCDGVMLGREAYHRPYLLWELQQTLVDAGSARPAEAALLARMMRYADSELARGESLSSIVRHMLGLYAGRPGAREFRRVLSEGARAANASAALLLQAARQVPG
jgi:tRNA-dihydrouridine synthase A